ncbi:phosphotransferase [Agrobacterium tumefaciens]|uniref:phosphotransferase n=1 Tax=Agrobacterium tumefaciens TaxID=358 RepID=UPI002243B121|nr:phosphotransferase [Agrobacterium tumefaciens]MCW8060464.1 aminoglycoside phosphotransferase family protein [Agrobacterium tumefaciens]MCW8145908.1 aminoglycoside phosphotransferase family protein [Agrobacterium tumefaciens]
MASDPVSEVVGSNAQQLSALFGLKHPVEGEALYRRIVDALGVSESINFATIKGLSLLPSGADSRAIIKVEGDFPYVIKVGAARIVENERRFLEDAGVAFPRILGYGSYGNDRWYAMEAGEPTSTERLVFSNLSKGMLAGDWFETLRDMTADLKEMMASSIIEHRCNVANYHYTKRIRTIFGRADFLEFAEKCLGSRENVSRVIHQGIRLNGEQLRGASNYDDAVSRFLREFPSTKSSRIHGDFHLKNVLRRRGGGRFLLIDPRLQWDDQPIDKFGYSDPIYDLSTMLHSVAAMTQILANIDAQRSDEICVVSINNGAIELDLKIDVTTSIETFLSRADELVPPECLTRGWEVRLLTGAANALFGWLKYENAIKTQTAWAAVYGVAVLFLKEAATRAEAR